MVGRARRARRAGDDADHPALAPDHAVRQPDDPPPVSANCTPGDDPCIVPGDDVDCEGEGDGPRFVRGPVYVEGRATYGLDADGNGVACEPTDF